MKALLEKIRRILRDRRTRKFLTRFVSGIAAVVVFVTTYALVLPAITMESQAACGIEAHQHDDSCYSEKLICGQEESEGHHHTDDCYTVTRELECDLEEHQHSSENGCFDEEGNVVCKLEEHAHTDTCYKEHRELTCGMEESEGHHHTDSCYEKVLTCGKEVHTHSAACYQVDPEVESAAVASTGMTSAAAVPDLSEKDYYSQESGDSEDDALVIKSLDEPEQTDADEDRDNGKISPEDNSEGETEADSEADIKDEKADRDRIKAESDDVDKDDERDKGKDKDISEEREEDASSFSTGFAADEDAENGDAYIPDKDALDFYTVLNGRTGIYYHHVAEDEEIEDSSAITDWNKADGDTELNPRDIVRVYLSYTLPKDTINATNDISRYRLPDALHLTDDQIEAINSCENGISAQYIDYDNLEITDPERHSTYLGLESVEGTRRPGEELKEDSQEYISAVVRAEKIYDEGTGEYERTDLIFTFSPYSVEKNAHAYDIKGQPTRAGEELTGWLTLDFNIGQIDWSEDKTSEIVFAEEDEENDISEISTVLRQADPADDKTDEIAEDGATEAAAEYATEEVAKATTTAAETAAENSTEVAVADTAATATTASETAAESLSEKTDVDAKTDSENDKDSKDEITAASYPAAVFDDSITVRSGRLDTDLADTDLPKKTKMTVHVEADEGTFPEGTKMVLSAVEDLDAVAETVGTAVDSKTRGFQAVDITFYDKDPFAEDAKEIEPLKPIRVSIKSDEIKKAAEDSSTAPVVVHIEDDNTATEIENTASKTDNGTIEIEKPGVEAATTDAGKDTNADTGSTAQGSDNGTDAGSDAAQSHTTNEETKPSVPNKNKDNENTEIIEPQQNNTGAETGNDISDQDSTSVESDSNQNAESSIDSSDISENHSDNSMEFSEKDMPEGLIGEPEDTSTKEHNSAAEAASESETGVQDAGTGDTVNFEADSFSVYAIVYTVDFHYEINGKTYEFSIPGGGFVSLEHVVEVLGIATADENSENRAENAENGTENGNDFVGEVPGVDASDENGEAYSDSENDEQDTYYIVDSEEAISEATKNFVANVENAEFSNPDVLWVGKLENDSTVRELKEKNELEVKYSNSLTVKDVAQINAQKVEAGDWALISVQPFTSEESLTVTLKNGDKFDIRISGNVSYGNEKVQYSSADGSMVVTAVAPVGALPAGTKIQLREIAPLEERDKVAEEEMQLYADAINSVANTLIENGQSVSEARICDISFIDVDGGEIEPSAEVDVSLMIGSKFELEEDETIGLAHINSDGKVEIINVNMDDYDAIFSSDAFSVYVVFKDNSTSLSEPVYLEDGWVRIGGDYKKPNPNELPNGSHDANDANGQKNYLRIKLYTLNSGKNQNSTSTEDYSLTKTFQYLYGTGNVVLEDYEFNGRINMIEFTPADREKITSKYMDDGGIKTSYEAEQAFHNWTETEWAVLPNVLNIYINTTKPSTVTGTEYVVRYYHADGSYDEVTGTLTRGQTFGIEPNGHMRNNETYSGLTIGAGHSALSNINTGAGSATISYNSNVSLVKANVYYKENIQQKTAGTVTGAPQYDAKTVNGNKIYDTSREGVHTDKTAAVTSNSDLQDGRTFDLTLETWNIGSTFANVGMVLDASGSMVWTSNIPTALKVPSNLVQAYGKNHWLTQAQVNTILDTRYTDNSKLNYNGYKYYILDPAYGVNEYVPLGYFDGSLISGGTTWTNGTWYRGMRSDGKFYASNDIQFANSTSHNGTFTTPTAGWYYVNSGKATQYKEYGTAKSYSNYDYIRSGADGIASQFKIDSNGYLVCNWWRTGKTSKNASSLAQQWESVVYVAANDGDNKSEVLQNSIAQFAAMLNAVSPSSQIAMTRFSRNNGGDDTFTSAQLALLDWTNNTASISAALNQMYGIGSATSSSTNGEYNYGFTGNTSTKTGITAFMVDYTNNITNQYTPTLTSNGSSKYLIIFTDGKDTDIPDSSNDSAIKQATKLKNAGYTIFTVLMQSAGMDDTEVSAAKTFLKELAGTKDSTVAEKDSYLFTSMYDDPAALVRNFQTIAKKIAAPLEGYMIRDYIDPRFDIVDSTGKVLTQLNPQGQWSPRSITLSDGKTAILKYDSEKEMFYVEIEQQTIPSTPKGATGNVVAVNTTTITVRAKSDFIGGEDILTNGNETEQNSVFKPVDGYSTQTDAPTQADTSADKKDFPKTTANPATLNISLANYEDTIFLGEDISPASLYENVQTKRDNAVDYRSVYMNYLVRAGQKFQDDPTYYVNLLKYASVPEGATNTDPSKDMNGNEIKNFVFQTDTKGVTTLTLPYYYLENPGDVTSFAGGTLHQSDKVGKVTYSWKALTTGSHTLTDNNALKDYTSTTLDTVRYQMSVSYDADDCDLTTIKNSNGQVVADNIPNNGSVRTQTLTNQKGTDNLIKDPVGDSAVSQSTNTETQGLAAIHIVDGKIKVIKKIEISQDDWNKLVTGAGESGLVFTFQLKRGEANYGTITINSKTAAVTSSGGFLTLETSDWITGLRQGDYTLEEIDQPSGFTFKSVTAAAIETADGGAEFSAPTEGSVIWKIGQYVSGTPATCSYSNTDFSAAKVKDDIKEVDPDKSASNGKNYLNAQIGKGIIENEPPKTIDVTLKKVDKDNLADNNADLLKGATFTITKYTDNTFSVKDTSASAWSSTLEDKKEGNSYTLNGTFEFKGLPVGFYKVDESVMPAGYVTMTDDPVFEVRVKSGTSQLEIVLYQKNGNTYSEVASGSTDMARIDAINTIYIANEPGAALPNTGGPGTRLFTILGSILILGAGILLWRRRRLI